MKENDGKNSTDKALLTLQQFNSIRLREEVERNLWKKCYQYVNSRVGGEIGQWMPELRRKQSEQGRPDVSFNIVKKYINRICGAQSALVLDDKVWPTSEDSDQLVADLLGDLVKHVKDINMAWIAIRRMFRDGVITGRGFLRCEYGNELDPFGEITIKCVSPLRVYLIGEGEEYDISRDRAGIIEEIPMDRDAVIARWGKSEEIKALPLDAKDDSIPVANTYDYGFGGSIPMGLVYDKNDDKLKVLKKQYVKYKKVRFLEDPTTKELKKAPESDTELEAAVEIAQVMGITAREVTKIVKQIYVCYSVGPLLLEEGLSPYKNNRFDLINFFCYTDDGVVTGVAQDLLDPQDEKNKRRSQTIHLLGTAAKNSYFIKPGAFDDDKKAEMDMGRTGALLVVKGAGALKDNVVPIESNMQAVPALLNMEDKAEADMMAISGITEAALGIVPQGVTSGRGINALQRPTETIIAEIHDNYIHSLKMLGTQIVDLIQQYYTEEKRIRVAGDYMAKIQPPEVVALKDQMTRQFMASGMEEAAAIMEAEKIIEFRDGSKVFTINRTVANQKLNDVGRGKYEFVVDQVASNPSMRQQQYQDMLNARSLGAPIPWDLIVKYSDIRGKAEVLSRMAEEEAKMMMAAAPPPKTATPAKAPEGDEMLNVGGAQF